VYAAQKITSIPVRLNADKAEAASKEGALTITIPKSESARVRKLKIKS
jgi:HSP20 family molecular chaperone IbpA